MLLVVSKKHKHGQRTYPAIAARLARVHDGKWSSSGHTCCESGPLRIVLGVLIRGCDGNSVAAGRVGSLAFTGRFLLSLSLARFAHFLFDELAFGTFISKC